MNIKLPCYPLVTIDPFMSIWSKTERLYESDTILWCNIKKRMSGIIVIDGKDYRFMGLGNEPVIEQTNLDVTPLITTYTFQNEHIILTVKFWTPLFVDDLYQLSLPCSFIECNAKSADGKTHRVIVKISLGKEFCYDKIPKPITRKVVNQGGLDFAVMCRKAQKPASKSGDLVSADWGYICLHGEHIASSFVTESGISAYGEAEETCRFIIAYDDIKSIEYMGKKYSGLWTERYHSIGNAIKYCNDNNDKLYQKALLWNDRILHDARDFGEDYQAILTAAYRQILAGHKLIRNDKGELLYFSKECNSNGCINTVDVSYPAIPFFLIYKPELIKGMMTGIFEFSRMNVWKFDFAPHDIGTYPIANGQAYGLYNTYNTFKSSIYKLRRDVYNFNSQMPVEECGNMLIMAYTHFLYSGDSSVIEGNYDILLKWAEYLKNVGIELQNQLCTDDFAGHSEKNINLAIKGIMGLAAFSKISDAMNIPNTFMETAQDYANELMKFALPNGSLPFAEGDADTWSLKYNLVWDKLLQFNLFSKDLYKAEIEVYHTKINKYGVPLDYRKAFTKTDWMMWASALDDGEETTKVLAKAIRKFLAETVDKVCFSDWIDTDAPTHHEFNHRTVQGGLWLPILMKK